ncbi:NAD(P)/FAD-dependent oxidoreductase [Actinocrinis puniceicyclus]|uniref:NAD(P)/FAD-dependent oxidoreductase n=1 Tax=Actinocrinis puniceicyclus TaxID=977794 RepID=A0A8J7WHG0_9ACTN|nr:FAD-dependent oxidoreductase [Actinocrinis puniceicyclus]MBS2962311.1 NAD(P)/FAD-dependent oxidoreductase [Actinocrinis puniceicyclus]
MERKTDEQPDESYDVVVVGGGAAGLSGAVALARSRRSVLVIDAGDPRNAAASHVHQFLTRDGTPPARFLALGRDEVHRYGGRVENGLVTGIGRDGDRFRVEIGGRAVTARRILLATGLRDELPDVPGLAERWGVDVLHCPYCHGWEVRDQRIGVLADSAAAIHQVLLFRQLSARVMLLQHSAPELSDAVREQLRALGVVLVEGRVAEVESDESGLTGVRLADGTRVALDALVVAPRFTARTELAESLGLAPAEVQSAGQVIGTRIEAEETGATGVPGVWVAGNLAAVQAQVVSCAAAGLSAGASINADLVMEDAARAVEVAREHGEQAWDERYRDYGHKHEHGHHWSGEPNAVLVAEAADLAPGTALDAGAGEGGDAVWLAARGWKVTAADLSSVALQRGRQRAEELGLEVTWLHADLALTPIQGVYDLVTSHYMHVPPAARESVHRNLAAAVAPGGTLLIVGHDPSDLRTTVPRPDLTEFGWSAGDLAASLGEGWIVEVAAARPREVADPEGRKTVIHDAVLRARREPRAGR